MKQITLILLVVLQNTNTGLCQQKYNSVEKLIKEVSRQYTADDKNLKIVSNDIKSPKLEIITEVIQGNDINTFNRKEIVLLAMQIFCYSNADEVSITATPLEITFTTPGNIKTKKEKLLTNYKTTAKITRAQALTTNSRLLNVKEFKDLFDTSFSISGIPNEKLKNAMYNSNYYRQLTTI
jgi:hypothetical protein